MSFFPSVLFPLVLMSASRMKIISESSQPKELRRPLTSQRIWSSAVNSGSESTHCYHRREGQGKVGGRRGGDAGSGVGAAGPAWRGIPHPATARPRRRSCSRGGRRPGLYRIWLKTKGRKQFWPQKVVRGAGARLGKGSWGSPARSPGSGKGREVSDLRPRRDGSGGLLMTRSPPRNKPE